MNKQELIDDIEKNKNEFYKLCTDMKSTGISRGIGTGIYMGLLISQKKIEQLDEQPKVTVPKFAADWIERCKEKATLADCLDGYYEISNGEGVSSEDFQNWVVDNENDELTAKAWMFGYEVEKESLYKVIIDHKYLVQLFSGRTDARLVEFEELTMWSESAYKLTEETIKAIDERYWAFAVPVEEVK
ncbi:DUF1642 domain-containing protein [Enterococcus gallinarum]|uniref:DUF1642 domain-containing protein n=1 Tax=Enterococcus gallinarum TaxID=1353 RepID=UPI002955B622|nr:DUF1642 domain-containing protein [Enterococcus gallinarum]MDV7740862.1 DUF1642 domain-containing protein [Enterococcus gallinarum]